MASLSADSTPRIGACRSTLSSAAFTFMFDIQLFGRIEVRTRGLRLSGTDFGGDRPRRLLALLALRGEASISELAELLGTGPKSVEGDLGILRQHLEPGVSPKESVIVTQRGRVSLDQERVRVDV